MLFKAPCGIGRATQIPYEPLNLPKIFFLE